MYIIVLVLEIQYVVIISNEIHFAQNSVGARKGSFVYV